MCLSVPWIMWNTPARALRMQDQKMHDHLEKRRTFDTHPCTRIQRIGGFGDNALFIYLFIITPRR